MQGSLSNQYAAPVTGGTVSNPVYYSAPYISTGGQPNTVTLSFNRSQSYFGLLWGSIGSGDYLSFYDAANNLLSSVSGTQAMMAAAGFNSSNGAQGFGGSQYTLINFLDSQFNKVVIGQSGGPSFEAAGFEYAAQNVSAVPEPTSIALAAVALMSCVALRRKS